MSWDTIIGQSLQVNILKKSLAADRLAHAYLFSGPEGIGKEAVAFELAKQLNCSQLSPDPKKGSCDICESCLQATAFLHPNIEYVFPVESVLLDQIDPSKSENKKFSEAKARYEALIEQKKRNPYFTPAMERSMAILTEQVSDLQQKAAFMPSGGGRKVFIISQAEKLNQSAANKLLKLLEEPPKHVLFILVSSRPESILPTIRSRCQILKFSRIKPAEMEAWLSAACPAADEDILRFIVNASRGNLEKALDLSRSITDQAAMTLPGIELRNRAIDWLRNLLTPKRLQEAIRETEEIAKNLSRQEIASMLASLLLFFQDINHRKIDPRWEGLNNPDLESSVIRFVQNFTKPDFYEVSLETETTIRSIMRNANPFLTLSAYAIRIKQLIAG